MKELNKQQNVFNKPFCKEVLAIIKEYTSLSRAQKKDERRLSVLIERYEKTGENNSNLPR